MTEVVLISPKFEVNVANARRACACFGVQKLVVVNRRYIPATGEKGDRKPRPLRMKAYGSVQVDYSDMFSPPADRSRLVVVERLDWATPLKTFAHPEDATYIFGPEDGNVPQWIRGAAKHIVFVPTLECLNLATTVALVLYKRSEASPHP
jgi:tRNA(Leu) C34 or U34 (ribose-2'-O)-methylase TrmL